MAAVILVVEDDLPSLELACYLLEHEGHRVHRAENGRRGLEAATTLGHSLDLILSDIQMPDLDGYQFLAELRLSPLLASKPVIAITAFSMRGDEQKILASGFDGYISKPIDPELFVHQVSRWLPPHRQP